MIDITRYLSAFKNLPTEADWAEVNADKRDEYAVYYRDGKKAGYELYTKTAFYYRVSADGKTGTVYTENSDEDISKLTKEAMECARYADGKTKAPRGGEASVSLNDPDQKSDEDIAGFCEQLNERAVKIPNVSQVRECSTRRMIQSRRVANSLGLDSYHEHTYYLSVLNIETKDSNGKATYSVVKRSADSLKKINMEEMLASIIRKSVLKTGNGTTQKANLPSGTYKCILSPDVVLNILLTSWQEFTGANMGSGVSAFHDKAGTVIGPEFLNIVNAPNAGGWGYNFALDSEGMVCEENNIVDKGRLVSQLNNAGRAALLTGLTPVNLITIPAVFYIKQGSSSPEEMIKQMDTGVYIAYSLDAFHSINIASGEFSIPCGGVVYEKGAIVGTIDQIVIAGNLKDLFLNIEAIGNDLQFDEFLYKNYCYGGPSLLVKNLTICS